ncbi:FAD-dependent oxidoreductase [Haloarcula nitratireducens]|uniref:FAD-dependent monooxygenase n=1 Tax=Haloarcula nitratireducens TaxID=2487749 RepID=A0AAW4P7Q9_9EURY|nr:FAD-dependent monooxygenase [Halomicroarcula nitratireducens]MBX0293924.1 FAD-dependent monooxygenase [Halomicroarcula nitratireducens]
MTLSSVPRYERGRVAAVGDRAVVVGASVAGLLAARVLSDGFERVTVVERDSLSDDSTPRKGVPQSKHPHALLEAGRATIEDLFPGYCEELLSEGGVLIDGASDVEFYDEGGFLADGPERIPQYIATRPLIEYVARRRLAEFDGVTLRSECQCVEYLTESDATAVTGIRARGSGDEETTVPADLVVDATGRTSRTPTWLDEHGFEKPPREEVEVDVRYTTVDVRRPPDDRRAVFAPASPPHTRGGVALPVEGDRWLVTLHGVHGDNPPADVAGVRDFAAGLSTSEFRDLLETHPMVSDEVAQYPFPSNRRYHYEALDQFPDGLLVLGDAIASFNPIYGQGMSVAALEALVLHHALAAGGRTDLAPRFFERAESVIDDAWLLAVGADFQFPATDGRKPRGSELFNRYLSRLTRKAHTDGVLRDALYRVIMMEVPPTSLLRPGIAWRVLKPT